MTTTVTTSTHTHTGSTRSRRAMLRLAGLSAAIMIVAGGVGFAGAAAWDHLGSTTADSSSATGGGLSSVLSGGIGG